MFDAISTVGLKVRPSKCVFGVPEVPYVGHILSAKGVSLMEAKVKVIVEMPAPVDVLGERSFMGLAGYYRKFVQNFSKLAKPANELTQASTPFVWNAAREEAFQKLKIALNGNPVLRC